MVEIFCMAQMEVQINKKRQIYILIALKFKR